jgi:hypothetical protein
MHYGLSKYFQCNRAVPALHHFHVLYRTVLFGNILNLVLYQPAVGGVPCILLSAFRNISEMFFELDGNGHDAEANTPRCSASCRPL